MRKEESNRWVWCFAKGEDGRDSLRMILESEVGRNLPMSLNRAARAVNADHERRKEKKIMFKYRVITPIPKTGRV
jgi:hypothetical protein